MIAKTNKLHNIATEIISRDPTRLAWSRFMSHNVFCPTGEGGGVDPTCKKSSSGVETIMMYGTEKVTVYRNPTAAIAKKWLRKSSYHNLRGFMSSDGDVFIWDGYEATHDGAANALGAEIGWTFGFSNDKAIDDYFSSVENIYCPTGEGGGIDPTCKKHDKALPIAPDPADEPDAIEGKYLSGGVLFDAQSGIGSTGYNSNVHWDGYAVEMTPQQFLDLNTIRPDKKNVDFFKEALKKRDPAFGPLTLYVTLKKNGDMRVRSHEGRGRAIAMVESGFNNPMFVHVFASRDNGGELRRNHWAGGDAELTDEIIFRSLKPDLERDRPGKSYTPTRAIAGKKLLSSATENIYCPTGEGGGKDPTCKKGSSSFSLTVKNPYGASETFKVEENPSVRTLLRMVKRDPDIRGIYDPEMKSVLFWPAYKATHSQVAETLHVSQRDYAKIFLLQNPRNDEIYMQLFGKEKSKPVLDYLKDRKIKATPNGSGYRAILNESHLLHEIAQEIISVRNIFCPTGEGGGVDPTCTKASHRTTKQAAKEIKEGGFSLEKFGSGAGAGSGEPKGIFLSLKDEESDFAQEVSDRGLDLSELLDVSISPKAKVLDWNDKKQRHADQKEAAYRYIKSRYGLTGEDADAVFKFEVKKLRSNDELMRAANHFATSKEADIGQSEVLRDILLERGYDVVVWQDVYRGVRQAVVLDPKLLTVNHYPGGKDHDQNKHGNRQEGVEKDFERRNLERNALQTIQDELDKAISDPISGMTYYLAQEYFNVAKGLVKKMPDECLDRFLANVRGIKFYDSVIPLMYSVYGPKKTDEMILANKFVGGAWMHRVEEPGGYLFLDGGKSTVDRFGNQSAPTNTMEHIYAHEFSHAFDGVPFGKDVGKGQVSTEGNLLDRSLSSTRTWKKAWESEILPPKITDPSAGIIVGVPLTNYAAKNETEGFAEFGRLMLSDPSWAKHKFPKCYKAWEDFGLISTSGSSTRAKDKAMADMFATNAPKEYRLPEIFSESDQVGNIHVDILMPHLTTENIYCATGEGGGVDPTCKKGEKGFPKGPDISKHKEELLDRKADLEATLQDLRKSAQDIQQEMQDAYDEYIKTHDPDSWTDSEERAKYHKAYNDAWKPFYKAQDEITAIDKELMLLPIKHIPTKKEFTGGFLGGMTYDEAIAKLGDEEVSRRFKAYHDKEALWEQKAKYALTMGQITQEQAKILGLHIGGGEVYKPLPEVLYHVTTAAKPVEETGLKTREELAMRNGIGLGGGANDTISFTDKREIAEDIYGSIKEARAVADGDVTVKDMLKAAERGESAEAPYLENLMHFYDPKWKKGSPYPYEVENYLAGRGREYDSEKMRYVTTPKATPEKAREDRFEFFKRFAYAREQAGGYMDPLFFGTDAEALSRVDPDEIRIVKVESRRGTVGYQVSALGEWRAHTGDAVEISEVYGLGDLKDRLVLHELFPLNHYPGGKDHDQSNHGNRTGKHFVETEEFKRWFGNSQVLDEVGNPLVVYHRTKEAFTEFFVPGPTETWKNKRGNWVALRGKSGRAYFFTDNPEENVAAHNVPSDETEGANIMPVFLKMEHPLILDDETMTEWARDVFSDGFSEFPYLLTDHAIAAIKSEGYDGIINAMYVGVMIDGEVYSGGTEYIVFDKRQIKSASGNRGTFDPEDRIITHTVNHYPGDKDHDQSRHGQRPGTKKGSQGTGQGTKRISSPPVQADGTVRLTHFSNRPGIKRLDPSRHGSGLAGQERRRKMEDPNNWINRTYYGIGVGIPGGYTREPGLGSEEYTASVKLKDLYDLGDDPENLFPSSYLDGNKISRWEKLIRDRGYKGYWRNHESLGLVAAVFDELPVTKYKHLENVFCPTGKGGGVDPTCSPPHVGRSKDAIHFSDPIVGPSGAKLLSYDWAFKVEDVEGYEGDTVSKRVSDWERAASNPVTGRDIVHQFVVKTKDGKSHTVSLESALELMGYTKSDAGTKKFKSIASTLKSRAKAQLELDRAIFARDKISQAVSAAEKQVASLSVPEIEEIIHKDKEVVEFRLGPHWQYIRKSPDKLSDKDRSYAQEQVTRDWKQSRVAELVDQEVVDMAKATFGVRSLSSVGYTAGATIDELEKRIKRFDRKINVFSPTTENIFCPTGEGGGVDPTCTKDGSGIPQEDKPEIKHSPLAPLKIFEGAEIEMEETGKYGGRTTFDLAKFLTQRAKQLHGGTIPFPEKMWQTKKAWDKETLEGLELMALTMADEIEAMWKLDPASADWYSDDVLGTLAILQEVYPELKDPVNRSVFTAFMAINSNGTSVQENIKTAIASYKQIEGGNLDVEVTWGGKSQASIQSSIDNLMGYVKRGIVKREKGESVASYEKRFAEITAKMKDEGTYLAAVQESLKDLADPTIMKDGNPRGLLHKTFTEKMLRDEHLNAFVTSKKDKKGSGDLLRYYTPNGIKKEVTVKGSWIMGPKVGSFYQNLNGNFDPITMDRWMARSMGRTMGTLVTPASETTVSNQTSRLAKEIAGFIKKEGSPEAATKMVMEYAVETKVDPSGLVRDRIFLKEEGSSKRPPVYYDPAALLKEAREANKTKYVNPKGELADFIRDRMRFGNKIDWPDSARSELNNGSKALYNGMFGENHGWTGSQRAYAYEVYERARVKLYERGVRDREGKPLNNASMQALWWYFEKNMYKNQGVLPERFDVASFLDVAKADYPEAYKKITRNVSSVPLNIGTPDEESANLDQDSFDDWVKMIGREEFLDRIENLVVAQKRSTPISNHRPGGKDHDQSTHGNRKSKVSAEEKSLADKLREALGKSAYADSLVDTKAADKALKEAGFDYEAADISDDLEAFTALTKEQQVALAEAYDNTSAHETNTALIAGVEIDREIATDWRNPVYRIAEAQEERGIGLDGEPMTAGQETLDGGHYEPKEEPSIDEFIRSQYPTSDYVSEATGFVLSDGKSLDMDYGSGTRADDHRSVLPTEEARKRWGWPKATHDSRGAALMETMKRARAVRVSAGGDTMMVDLSHNPTSSQIRAINDYINDNDVSEIYFDVNRPDGGIGERGVVTTAGSLWRKVSTAFENMTSNEDPTVFAWSQFALNHLPGGHDQKTHGRGGKRERIKSFYKRVKEPDSGFTYDPSEAVGEPTTGKVVSPYPERSRAIPASKLRPRDLLDYLNKHKDLISKPGTFMGGWHNPASGQVFLDVVVVTQSRAEAKRLAQEHDQIAYFDLDTFETIVVDPNATSGGVANEDGRSVMAFTRATVDGLVNFYEKMTGKQVTPEELAEIKAELGEEDYSDDDEDVPLGNAGNIKGLGKHLAHRYGEKDKGYFTRCMGAEELEEYDEEVRKRICAKAHKEQIGKWPGEGRGKKKKKEENEETINEQPQFNIQLTIPPEAFKIEVNIPEQKPPQVLVQPKIEVKVPEKQKPSVATIKHSDGTISSIEVD